MIYQKICSAVIDAKGLDLVVYNINKESAQMDFVITTSASSTMHIQGICQKVKQNLKQQEIFPFLIEGERGTNWVLMDYGDTLLHIMLEETREEYDLEELYEKYFGAKKIALDFIEQSA